MTREVIDGTTYSYTYDKAGNLLTGRGHTYTYGNSTWGDLLTKFDGETISYDTIGNPTSYYNGTRWTFGWENGRQLVSASGGGKTVSYVYDQTSGLRLSKTVDGVTYTYIYEGDQLMRMTVGSDVVMDFFYDHNGQPYAVKYNGTTYYYVLNLQGDVVKIVSSTGTSYGTYTYDAWGNILYATNSALMNNNPLRYRGYVYDVETKLYYCQSRYYDPEVGRFINADSFASTGQGVIGNNMFAYCLNNPVMGYDPTGRWDWGWEEQALLGTNLVLLGLALLFAPPTGGASLGAWALSTSTITLIGSTTTFVGTLLLGDSAAQATVYYAKKSRKSDKEKSKDKPSWVSRDDIDPNKSAQQNAKELMDNKHGSNWPKGTREYSQIVKWINRCVRDLAIAVILEWMEE